MHNLKILRRSIQDEFGKLRLLDREKDDLLKEIHPIIFLGQAGQSFMISIQAWRRFLKILQKRWTEGCPQERNGTANSSIR